MSNFGTGKSYNPIPTVVGRGNPDTDYRGFNPYNPGSEPSGPGGTNMGYSSSPLPGQQSINFTPVGVKGTGTDDPYHKFENQGMGRNQSIKQRNSTMFADAYNVRKPFDSLIPVTQIGDPGRKKRLVAGNLQLGIDKNPTNIPELQKAIGGYSQDQLRQMDTSGAYKEAFRQVSQNYANDFADPYYAKRTSAADPRWTQQNVGNWLQSAYSGLTDRLNKAYLL